MATYKQIQEYVRDKYGYSPKTCWIAHMKDVCGLQNQESHQIDTLQASEQIHALLLNKPT